jgi:hypothetical protein
MDPCQCILCVVWWDSMLRHAALKIYQRLSFCEETFRLFFLEMAVKTHRGSFMAQHQLRDQQAGSSAKEQESIIEYSYFIDTLAQSRLDAGSRLVFRLKSSNCFAGSKKIKIHAPKITYKWFS